MWSIFTVAVSLTLLSLTTPCHALPQSSTQTSASSLAQQRAKGVQEAFQFAWNGYYKYAFPNDELHPVSNGYGNSGNGWGASAIDALSTALVMNDSRIVNQIIDFVPTIDFAVSIDNEQVSVLETTIRYLAGLISAHDLLTGPLSNIAVNKTAFATLIPQAERLASLMSFAFDTPSGVPFKLLTYAELTQKGESFLLNPAPSFNQPFSGLVGTNIGLKRGLFRNAKGGWIGGDDSFYEYLIKMQVLSDISKSYIYDPSRFSTYKDRWVSAVESSMQYLASHPSSRPDLTYLAEFRNKTTVNESGHLACFDGGNFILGGSALNRSDIADFGLKLVAGCHNTYTSTATRIGPEEFSWNSSRVPSSQSVFFKKNGFYILDASYDLRPEVIESYYYAFQYTGNSITGSGFAALNDVNVAGGGGFIDNQESFLFAEVMKYSYLIQAPDQEYDFNHHGANRWVYNTEAHPFKVAGTPV